MKALLCCLLGLSVPVSAVASVCSASAPSHAVVVSAGFATTVETTTMSKDRVTEAPTVEAGAADTQASMVITGRITVGPDGSVRKYSVDRQGDIPPAVQQLVGESVPDWRFKPIDGGHGHVAAQALMSLRIIARQSSSKAYTVAIQSAQFGNAAAVASGSCAANACITYREVETPKFPICELSQAVTGTVYVAVQLGDDGHVAKSAVLQVDLRNSGTAAEVESWRNGFANAALAAISKTTFNVPVVAAEAQPKTWTVIVPINFYTDRTQVAYGHWDLYYPGPVHEPAWVYNRHDAATTKGGVDAVSEKSGMYEPDPRFVLLTPPGGLPPLGDTGHG